MAETADTSLNVEPGSSRSVMTRLRRVSAEYAPARLGSNAGTLAMASTAPVRGSSATAVPAAACVSATPRASSSSRMVCLSRSIVRMRDSP